MRSVETIMLMNRLVIFDCSPYLWAGTKSETGQRQVHYGFRKGGIQMIMEAIHYEVNARQAKVIVMFDSKTNRKEYMPTYKGNRIADPEVYVQEQLLLQELKSAGVQVYKEEGFESDDLIMTAVQQNYDLFNKIIVKTNDMDLAACIDAKGKVSIESPTSISYNVERMTYEAVLSTTSTAKDVIKKFKQYQEFLESTPDISMSNFSYAVQKGNIVFFNSITPFKVFFGDKSDGVSEFTYSGNLMHLYLEYCEWVIVNYNSNELLSDVRPMIRFYQENPLNLNEDELDDLYNRIHVFYPRQVKINMQYDSLKGIDQKGFIKIANNYGIKKIADFYHERLYTSKQQQDILREIAHKITSGKVAIGEGLPLTDSTSFVDEKTQNIDIYMGANVGEF